jgi:steroid Delta-isomerase
LVLISRERQRWESVESVNRIISYFENMNIDSLKELDSIYHVDAYFKDPFNELIGVKAISKIYHHMFQQLIHPQFKILDSVIQDDALFITWDFTFQIKKKKESVLIHGSTHFKLNTEGLIIYHRDYWDVGEEIIKKVPVMGKLYLFLFKSFKVDV